MKKRRTVRYENVIRKEYDNVIFLWARGCEFFTPFICIEFHSINEPSTENNYFNEFVKNLCFGQFFDQFFLRILDYGKVIQ